MRLFVAICLPREAKEALGRGIAELKRQGNGNFTRPENLHLTLAFLGDTDRWKQAVRAMETIDAPAFSLSLKNSGSFGDLIWAGADLTEPLKRLQQQVTQALQQEGFALEDRPFRPHLTLCRHFSPYDRLDKAALESALRCTTVPVEAVYLMRSDRINGKLTYTPVFSKPLKHRREESI